jgi:branched-chain amino acid transport system substrate-binding protein
LTNAIRIIDNAQGLNLLGGDSVYNPRVLKDEAEKAASSKLTIAIPWHRHPDSDFAKTAGDFWGAEVNWRTATSYDAANTIIKALEESNGNYSREQLQKTLSSPNFVVEGVTGEIRFNEKGDRLFEGKNNSVLVQVELISGKSEFVLWER